MFYDGSGCTDPHLGGVGFAVFREGKEICGGFETIPLGSNNIGELVGARSLVVNSTMSNPRGVSSNPSFSIL